MNKKEQQRLAREAERAAEIQARGEAWRAQVDKHFAYLQTCYGFEPTKIEAENWWVVRVVYQTPISAVYVDFSVEYQAVEVTLACLLDKADPAYPHPSKTDNPGLRFDLTDLLRIRALHLVLQTRKIRGLGKEQVEASLAFLAHALNEHAEDFLRGDFSIFVALHELLEKRVQGHQRRRYEAQSIPSSLLQFTFEDISRATDDFCTTYVDEKLAQLCRQAVKALCLQDPSPLSAIRFASHDAWAGSIIHALCTINHLFADEPLPAISESLLAETFTLNAKMLQSRSKKIRALLKMEETNGEWRL